MKLVFLGDTQRTHWSEILVGREQNDAEREAIVRSVSSENADAVFFLGDLVSIGANHSHWEAFDRLILPLVEKRTPLFTVYGNHDYFYGKDRAESFMRARFPHLRAGPWGSFRFGDLTVVTLDSNAGVLSATEWGTQKEWFRTELARLDGDSAVRGIVVALHHPPYTNSRRSRASRIVRDELVPLFGASRKTLALLSGHCHAYERFEKSGKTYLVSGGAGGPRARMLAPKNYRHPDLYLGGETLRPFHYLRFQLERDGILVTVPGFEKGESETRPIDRFELRYL